MSTRRVGFVIANDDEEYLHDFFESRGAVVKTWARHPDFALVFVTRLEARQMVWKLRQDSKLWVLELFDSGSQLIVVTSESERPTWLSCDSLA